MGHMPAAGFLLITLSMTEAKNLMEITDLVIVPSVPFSSQHILQIFFNARKQ